ncbi:hypothetical protein HPB51_003044 [Rhipicephalus microplus]|uniref:Uncharacterized protein n=1 Tax=Rhipicephalus microplus TaxID=6941 RepID=A0A9J6EL18_RHIMP|nr:hypothetical protein HPB51_003044 [Rhipicephalus microplus]
MSCIELTPPHLFLPEPGLSTIPYTKCHQTIENYLLASGASGFPPERRKALLLQASPLRVNVSFPVYRFQRMPLGSVSQAPTTNSLKLATPPLFSLLLTTKL